MRYRRVGVRVGFVVQVSGPDSSSSSSDDVTRGGGEAERRHLEMNRLASDNPTRC